MEQNERRSTVLIDADNVSPKYIRCILDEVSGVGIATYKRICGDWTGNEKHSWKNMPLGWPVNPIQQYSYTAGKNATGSAMIIDAMDIFYLGNVDGFCLVSSDSDFIELAQRLREAEVSAMGIGKQKTLRPSRTTCDTFKLLGIISSDDTPETSVIENQKATTNIDEAQRAITKLLAGSNSQSQPITLAGMGNFLTKHFSDLGVRDYGYPKLSTFLESLNDNDFRVAKFHGGYFAQEKNASISKAEIEKEIIHVIGGCNGHVDNLGIIYDELKKTHPFSDVKQYGFSRISGFIRGFGTSRVKGNMVQFKQRRQRQEGDIQPVDESLSRRICLPISF